MTVKDKIENYLEYIMSICIILNSNSIWTNGDLKKLNMFFLCFILSIVLFISIRGIIINQTLFLKSLIVIISIVIYNSIFIIANGQNTNNFIINFIFIFIVLIFYSIYKGQVGKVNSLIFKISNLIVILSFISLIFYIFGSCFKIISPNSETFLNWGVQKYIPSYYGLYYETQATSIKGITVIRNSGMFTEAPMYAFNLCIALIVELFLKEYKNNKRIILLLTTIATTFSTTGIIIMLGLIIINIKITKSKSWILLLIKRLIFPIIFLAAMSISIFLIGDKINQSQYGYRSYSVRVDDFKVGIDAWSKHIIIGHGYNRYDLTQQYMSINDRGSDIGGSSSLMKILPEGGLYLLSIYLIPLILALFYGIRNKKNNVLIFAITITILFVFVNIPYTYMMIYILALGWSCLFRKEDNRREHISLNK
ncbi:hypothetical protein [Clostridium diolis]|uniref:hypothetical protein n=1 Tax=Clostridium diolis TaxID=223919 RepID=UPI003AF86783